MNNKLNTIDLFAGCGGLSEGFESSGLFTTLGVVEWDKSSLETLVKRLKTKWNHKDIDRAALFFDMQRTDELINGWSDRKYGTHIGLKKAIKLTGKKVDVIVGGPPCQAYSIAGRVRDKHGMRYDYRNYLFETYLKMVEEFKPKLFVFENVLGLLSAKPGDTPIETLIREAFSKIGYVISDDLRKAVFDVSDFGVPQVRRRLVIIGLRKNVFRGDMQKLLDSFYSKLSSHHAPKKVTVAEAIFDLPKAEVINDGKISHKIKEGNTFLNHAPRYHSVRDIEIFKELSKDLKRKTKKYQGSEDLKRLYTERTGKKSRVHKYHVLDPNKPANTIVAHLYKDGLRHIHPDPKQARSITVREAARLQSFPDDFEFLGSMGDQYKMIGNAVPPKFARIIALVVKEFIQTNT